MPVLVRSASPWQGLGHPTEDANNNALFDDECFDDSLTTADDESSATCSLRMLQHRMHLATASLNVESSPQRSDADASLGSSGPSAEVVAVARTHAAKQLFSEPLPRGLSALDEQHPLASAKLRGQAGGSSDGDQAIGRTVQEILRLRLPRINQKLKAAIPSKLEEVYNSSSESQACCGKSPWGCWCHCNVSSFIELNNVENADSIRIIDAYDALTDSTVPGKIFLTILLDLAATELSGSGRAQGALAACGMNMPSLSGGLAMTLSANGTAVVKGDLVSHHDGFCFNCKEVHLDIPQDNVQFLKNTVSIGGWDLLKLDGNFWDSALHKFPMQRLLNSVSQSADGALRHTLGREPLCF